MRAGDVVWAVLLLACSGDARSSDRAERDAREAPSSGGSASVEPASPSSPAELAEVEAAVARRLPVLTPIAKRVLDVLAGDCGSAFYDTVPPLEDTYVAAVARLIASGDIVPGSSATSPLLGRLRTEPGSSCASEGELTLLAQFIDELDMSSPTSCEPAPFMSHDQLYALLANDSESRPAADRPFIRYLGLTYASNAGVCGQELHRERYALFKLINSVSTNPVISVPQPVDADSLLYRVDIRSYGWARAIDLEDNGSVDHADAWLAIVDAAAPYAVQVEGEAANRLEQATGTPVSFLPVNVFVQSATTRDVYYALTNGRSNMFDTAADLGVGFGPSGASGTPYRAGFTRVTGAYESGTRVTRLEQVDRAERSFWVLEEGKENLMADPLGAFEGGSVIYTLPNGMHAYGIAASNGVRLGELPYGCVGFCSAPAGAVNAAGCHGCHSSGIIGMADRVREAASQNPEAFDPQSLASVLAQYLPRAELERFVAADSSVHTAATLAAGIPAGTPDPISHVFVQFERGRVTAEVAAAALGVTTSELLANLSALDPRFQRLAEEGGYIAREVFTDGYQPAMCTLQRSAANAPVNCPSFQ